MGLFFKVQRCLPKRLLCLSPSLHAQMGSISLQITKNQPPLLERGVSGCRKSLPRGRLFHIYEVKWSRVRKMMEKGKMERGVVELVDTESLVPQEHLLRKVDRAVEFRKLYEIVEPLYSEEEGRTSIDPVVLFKIVLLQHLDGIPSLRGTLRRAQTDIAYRWFLGYTLNEELPHFSTVSYNFRHRFTEETIERVFQWVLNEAGTAGALSPAAVFIDGTHIKASANLNKKIKQEVPAAAKRFGMSCWRRSTQTGRPMGRSPSMTTTIRPDPQKRSGTTPQKRSWRGGRRQASKQ